MYHKQKFINMLGGQLENIMCIEYIMRQGMLTFSFVKKAVESAAIVNTGDDTDLLILLRYHASFDSQRIFFQSEPIAKKSTKNSEVQLSQINTFVNKPEHLVYSQLPLKMSLLQGNECRLAFTMRWKNGEDLDSLCYKQ